MEISRADKLMPLWNRSFTLNRWNAFSRTLSSKASGKPGLRVDNAAYVTTGARKMTDLKLADLKMTDQIVRKMGEMKLAEMKIADLKMADQKTIVV